jgi:hypothetical protein
MRNIARACALGTILWLAAGASGRATVLLPADLGVLVRGAQAVVHGRVAAVRAEWVDGRRRIDSLVTVAADEYFKGDFGPAVTFRAPGGEIGRYRSVMVGAPVFQEGDDVVLFLNARGPSIPYVLGLSQGVFRVVTDPRSSARLVTPPALLAGTVEAAVTRGDPARRPVPLAAFGAEVRRLAAEGGAR